VLKIITPDKKTFNAGITKFDLGKIMNELKAQPSEVCETALSLPVEKCKDPKAKFYFTIKFIPAVPNSASSKGGDKKTSNL
jgi:hypothetical protein